MTTIQTRGQLTVDGQLVACPKRHRTAGTTLIAAGPVVNGACGRGCFWPVGGLPPAALATMARGTPGKAFRLTLPDGRKVEGYLAQTAAPATASGKAAAAVAAKTGKTGAVAKPGQGAKGGALVAALQAVTAIAQTGTAAAAAVGAAAGATGKIADMGREGIRTGRAAIDAADAAGARRFARDNARD